MSAEHLRNALLCALGPSASPDMLDKVGTAFDRVISAFQISEAETHLTVIGRDELENLIKTYLVVKRMEGLSERTLAQYAIYLRKLMLFMSKPPPEISANDIRLFLWRYQQERGISDRSLDRIRSCVSSFFGWAAAEEYIPRNPCASIRAIRFEQKPRRAISQIDLERLRRACRTHRESAILEMLYSTGCRVSELVGIRIEDIDWTARSVHLVGKGRKHRTSYINAKAEVAAKQYIVSRKQNSGYLIAPERGSGQTSSRSIERTLGGIVERAGLDRHLITPHILRHTTATQALRSGMQVEDIQRLLGHSSIATTMIYAETSADAVAASHRKYII